MRIPPTAGPSAAPRTPAATQIRSGRPRRSSTGEEIERGVTMSAAPTACTHRAPTRTRTTARARTRATPPRTPRRPTANASRGRRRATYAAGTATTASTRLNDVSTHATDVIATSNSPRISGQRQGDDRRVGEREPDAEREQPVRCVTRSRGSARRAPRSARWPHADRPRAPRAAPRVTPRCSEPARRHDVRDPPAAGVEHFDLADELAGARASASGRDARLARSPSTTSISSPPASPIRMIASPSRVLALSRRARGSDRAARRGRSEKTCGSSMSRS